MFFRRQAHANIMPAAGFAAGTCALSSSGVLLLTPAFFSSRTQPFVFEERLDVPDCSPSEELGLIQGYVLVVLRLPFFGSFEGLLKGLAFAKELINVTAACLADNGHQCCLDRTHPTLRGCRRAASRRLRHCTKESTTGKGGQRHSHP